MIANNAAFRRFTEPDLPPNLTKYSGDRGCLGYLWGFPTGEQKKRTRACVQSNFQGALRLFAGTMIRRDIRASAHLLRCTNKILKGRDKGQYIPNDSEFDPGRVQHWSWMTVPKANVTPMSHVRYSGLRGGNGLRR